MSLNKTETESTEVLESAQKAVKKAIEKDEEYRFILDIDDETKTAIHENKITLAKENGVMVAQIRDEKGQYSKKLPVKEELAEEGITPEALELAMQTEAIKDQLRSIIETLQQLENRIGDVIQGQRNDRAGLYYSGLSLFTEARTVTDGALKKQIYAQALKSLSDANSQIIQDMRTSVSFLVNEQYKQAGKNYLKQIEEHLDSLQQCYQLVFRSSFLKAAIYHENGEIPAMLTAIDEYGRFIEKLITPYAGLFSEMDRREQFIESGTWGTIAHTLCGCRELKAQIEGNKTYTLCLENDSNARQEEERLSEYRLHAAQIEENVYRG